MKFFNIFLIAVLCIYSCKNVPEGVVTMDATQAKALIAKSDSGVTIVDVRTPAEAANGSLKGAIVIDVENDSFKTEIEKLDKNGHYLVYCKSGIRSAKAVQIMKDLGFQNIIYSSAGYEDLK